mmetsp:Transcript_3493/g.4303  ORF Transcript_3493/g.4303 Transcript_3493/m.4303 type:complete len:237 (-) Transcript_3493:110-820(-)
MNLFLFGSGSPFAWFLKTTSSFHRLLSFPLPALALPLAEAFKRGFPIRAASSIRLCSSAASSAAILAFAFSLSARILASSACSKSSSSSSLSSSDSSSVSESLASKSLSALTTSSTSLQPSSLPLPPLPPSSSTSASSYFDFSLLSSTSFSLINNFLRPSSSTFSSIFLGPQIKFRFIASLFASIDLNFSKLFFKIASRWVDFDSRAYLSLRTLSLVWAGASSMERWADGAPPPVV